MKLELTEKLLAELKAENYDQVLARLCIAAKLLSPHFDDAKAQLKERLGKGGEVITPDGTRLWNEEKPGQRELTNRSEGWHRLAGHWREKEHVGLNAEEQRAHDQDNNRLEFVPGALKEADALDCVKISLTEVEKKIAEVNGLPLTSKRGESGKARTEALFEGIVEKRTAIWLMIQ